MNWLMVQEQWENQQMYGFVVDDFEKEEEVVDVIFFSSLCQYKSILES